MEDIVDLIATDSSASDISTKIKEVLFNKASERIENLRPQVAMNMFDSEVEVDTEEEE
jgi:hypothetical protein